MAVLTVFHWSDLGRGLDEVRRIARRAVVVTVDPDVVSTLWIIADYVPEMIAHVARLPAIDALVGRLAADQVVSGVSGQTWRTAPGNSGTGIFARCPPSM